MIVASALIVAAARLISDSAKQSKQQEVTLAESENVARAGLVDAINYFRRTKNVAAGYPSIVAPFTYIDDAFSPTINATAKDTLDPSIGIVNQYQVDSAQKLWARYEIKKQGVGATDIHAAHDLTGDRVPGHHPGEGLDWTVESLGYVFRMMDPTLAFNVYPNQVLATTRMSTEIRKMGLTLPVNAAAMAVTMFTIISKGHGKIRDNGGGSFDAGATSMASGGPITLGGNYQGSFYSTNLPAQSLSDMGVFGLAGPTDVKNLADYIGTQASPINFQGSYKLAYYEGDVTYSPGAANTLLQSLNASGVLYVHGNLTIQDGTSVESFFDGLIYATGAVTIGCSTQINGCVIGRNGVVVGTTSGTSTDFATITFDATRIANAQSLVATYRENRSATRTLQPIP